MKLDRSVLILCVAFSLWIGTPGVCLAGSNSQASVYMDCNSAPDGQTIEVAVWVEGVQKFKGFDIEIVADSSRLIILDKVEEGDFLSSLGGKTFFIPRISEGNRLWVVNAVEGSKGAYTPSGAGRLFTFKVQRVGDQSVMTDIIKYLSFEKVVLADSNLEKDQIVGGMN